METARNFAQSKLMPRILEANRKERFDREIMNELGSLGFLGCTISEYDLPGISSVAYGNILFSLLKSYRFPNFLHLYLAAVSF